MSTLWYEHVHILSKEKKNKTKFVNACGPNQWVDRVPKTVILYILNKYL